MAASCRPWLQIKLDREAVIGQATCWEHQKVAWASCVKKSKIMVAGPRETYPSVHGSDKLGGCKR
jgi:hypothetical protein